MPLEFDPEYKQASEALLSQFAGAPPPKVHDVHARRTGSDVVFAAIAAATPDPDSSLGQVDVSEHKHALDDGTEISVHRFVKRDSGPSNPPAILHCHGGGMIMGSVPLNRKFLENQVLATGVQVFSVEYRLAPEYPDPIPVEDCYASLVWLSQHAHEYGVDNTRIAVMGESAGGGLAAGVALLARDRHFSPPVARQILIYPMLDDRNTKVNVNLAPWAFWSYEDNITGWTALLGDKAGAETGVRPYAAAARAGSVAGLPPTYIDTGELDIFRDEDIAYAARLAAADISLEFHLYPGVPHAFDILAPEIGVTKQAVYNRHRAIARI
ncbi:hypothetical protein LTR10_022462 [Elasticomyces elasticus]|uniref:Alpha/beta hydrolase fold-3 domain-containing protein n=1 Tax=Exophiala sideris TaxID=1016849 RepID=A0ABR0J2H1_9EURO|nr:hypothetical protein LTR10_022462 [Elasticomyces elasticus]KAK5024899.1 hypothetical protein LTS07_008277 [Exophiala sideris]KAK5031511.1 hypothetical protein LTR13_007839 [Exophiala sideris]KAK5054938.1 hypothetical protein LTR69_008506 [Exophiala sideris]KAK5179817.1 hypothetical protein LTR44_007633 [Eurotiomycetes sp. CCFEE 6388]